MVKINAKKRNVLGRIFITLVGIAMILMAVNNVGLMMFGNTTRATDIKTNRRNSADSDHPASKQYRWTVSWTFMVEGEEYSGSATVRGSAFNVKHGSTVYYYSFAPQINSLFAKDSASIWTVVQIGFGLLLIFFVNKKEKRSKRYVGKSERQVEEELSDYDDSVEEFYQERK